MAGFEAKEQAHRDQVLVHHYKDDDNFTIELKTKAENDEVIVIKSNK